jgi:drug/metabolite transporter (DMT)-like permease
VQQPPPSRPYVVLSVALLAVSLAAIFIRLADAPGVVIATYRMVIASLTILPLSLRTLRRSSFTRRNLSYAILAGVFLGLHFATWISSLSLTSVAASVSLVASQPLWVALLGWIFLKQPPSFLVLLGAMIAVTGGAVISFSDYGAGTASLLGNSLAIIGAIGGAAYLLLGRAAQRHGLTLNGYIGVAYSTAAVVLLPWPLIFGHSYTDYSLPTFGWIIVLALIPQLVGHTGINYAMKYLSPTLVATLLLLEPLGASLFALILFQETPTLTTALGAVVLLSGVAMTVRGAQQSLMRKAKETHNNPVTLNAPAEQSGGESV